LGAAAGAVGAGSQYVDTSKGDYLGQKAFQTGLGAAVGGVANVAMPWIAKGVGGVWQKAKGVAAQLNIGSTDDLLVTITNRARSSGIDLSNMPEQVQAGFMNDALDQLRTTGNLDVASLARKSNLEQWGYQGTVGQVTRNPGQWQTERNLMQLDEIGDPLRNRFVQQNQQMMTNAERLAGRFGPEVPEQQIGLNVRDVSSRAARASQETVGDAYTAGANAPGIGSEVVDVSRFRDRLTEVYASHIDQIPAPIQTRLAELVDGGYSPTVENVQQAAKLVNAALLAQYKL
jgi:hypothetical protein